MRLVHADVGIGATGQFDLGTAGRVGRAGAALEHAGAGQQLGAMADGGHGLVVVEEVAHGGNIKPEADRKSTRLNSSHLVISYAVFCLKKKKKQTIRCNTESATRVTDTI